MTTLFTIATLVPRYIHPPSCIFPLHSAYREYIVYFAYSTPLPATHTPHTHTII